MYGRYGNDSLNRFLSTTSLVLMVIALITRGSFLYYLGFALLIWVYIRMFSRNIARRSQENAAFYQLTYKWKDKLRQARVRSSQRDIYRYYRCPNCRQQLRVPKGRGKILITCPKCRTEFTKKS